MRWFSTARSGADIPSAPRGSWPGPRTTDGSIADERWTLAPTGCPRPDLFRPDLVHLLERFHEFRVEIDGAYARDDECEAYRLHELTHMLCTPEADTWIAALHEAQELWESARPAKTFETAHMWIQLPAHLANSQLHP